MSPTDTAIDSTVSGVSPAGEDISPPPPPRPAPTPPDLPPAKPRESSVLGRLTIGAMLLGMGVLAILDNISALDITAQPRHYLALAVTVLGVGLLVGSVIGRARWLILIGVLLVPTLMFSPAFEYDWDSPEFNRELNPTSFEELPVEHDLDIGRLELDLTDLPWDGREVPIAAEVAIGSLEITVPDGVGIVGEAAVDIGVVQEPGRSSSGLGDPNLTWNTPGELGTVLLDASVNIGSIEISR